MKKLICFAVTLAIAVIGLSLIASANDQTVTRVIPEKTLTMASAYWTAQRTANAKPYPMPTATAPAQLPTVVDESAGIVPGEPQATKAALPGTSQSLLLSDAESDSLLSAESQRESTNGVIDLMGYAYPPPQTTYYVFSQFYGTTSTIWPYTTIGKAFFSQAGSNYTCSASSLGGSAVLTAGHCVSNGSGTWSSNFVFVPAYKKVGTTEYRPFGTWTAKSLTTFTAWHTHKNLGRDVGFAVMKLNTSGYKLSQIVGNLGAAWNYGRIIHWDMFGYPAEPIDTWTFDGTKMVQTEASFAKLDTYTTAYTPKPQAIGTVQTPGCSGGPWIMAWGTGYWANSVNSYKYITPSEPYQIYGPYFDTTVGNVILAQIAK